MNLKTLEQFLVEGLQEIAPLEELPHLIQAHNSHSKKESKVTIRLTPAEKEMILERAQGMTLTAYIRAGLFGYQMRPIVPQVNRETYIELRKIGNHLNQIARVLNTASAPERDIAAIELATLQATLSDIIPLIHQIQKDVLQISNLAQEDPQEERNEDGEPL